ncbi:uncharacterized protein LOC134719368 isoform X2 [Mytilus trossulus]|uniref:uncharacterized protein LOC134719368 isoform X2 n=1 Tax=Mytilus trossulus TaxID=6551 RepID=UPI003004F11A
MTTRTKKSTAAKTTIASTLYTTLITTASMTSTTGPALSRSTFIDADIDVVIVTSAVISLLYYFTKYSRNLRRRTWYSGSHYTQEGDKPGTSDLSS